jgi:hypothetical protein
MVQHRSGEDVYNHHEQLASHASMKAELSGSAEDHKAAARAHAAAGSAAGNEHLAQHHLDRATEHAKAAKAGGTSSKAAGLKAFASEGKKKEAAVKGPLMKGKKGGTYRLTKTGKKIYTK